MLQRFRLSRAGSAASTLLLALVLSLAGCSDGLEPDEVDVSGAWILHYQFGATDFHFVFEEGADGVISGRWSGPSRFSYHQLTGRRVGLTIDITADSPNIFPVQLTATLVNKSRMEGHQYYGGTTEKIILRRETVT